MFARLFARISFVGLAILACSAPFPACAQDLPAQASNSVQLGEALPDKTVIAETANGNITVADVRQGVEQSLIPNLQQIPPAQVSRLPKKVLVDAAQYLAARFQAARELKGVHDPLALAFCRQQAETAQAQRIGQSLVKEFINDKLTTPSQDEIAKYYKQHLPVFTHPQYFKMRHLILYTYARYIVRQGDTLEGVAKEVNGDEKSAALIRADVEQRPLRREPGKSFKPLVTGECLLVPMNDAQAGLVKEKLESLLAQLKNGVKFEDLATSNSDAETKGNEIGPLPSGSQKILPELLSAGLETPIGQPSKIFRTKHGWNVIQVTDRKTTETDSLDKSTPRIIAQLQDKQRQQLMEQLLTMLLNQPGIEIELPVFKNAEKEPPTTSTLAFVAGEHKVLWNDIQRQWQMNNSPTAPDGIRRMMRNCMPALQACLLHYVDRTKTSETDAAQQRAEEFANGAAYFQWMFGQNAQKGVTDRDVEKYYADNKEFFKKDDAVSFDSMALALPVPMRRASAAERDKALKSLAGDLNKKLSSVTTAEEFTQTALQVNEPLKGTPDEPLKAISLVAVKSLPVEFITALSNLKTGKWSKPFIYQTSAVAVLLTERTAGDYRPLADCRAEIRQRLIEKRSGDDALKALENQFTKNAKFKPALD